MIYYRFHIIRRILFSNPHLSYHSLILNVLTVMDGLNFVIMILPGLDSKFLDEAAGWVYISFSVMLLKSVADLT